MTAPNPAPPTHALPHLHVTSRVCELKHCGWTGFHFHWRHRRYRTARQLSPAELDAFDADCHLLNAHRRSLREGVIPDG